MGFDRRCRLKPLNSHGDRFRGWNFRPLRMMPERNKRIAFRVIATAAALRNIIRGDPKPTDRAILVIACIGDQSNVIAFLQAQPHHVARFINTTMRVP